jgi:hypothetical protein
MGCHSSAVASHNSGGGWGFLKKLGGFLYHASGASDVVGCVTHATWGGCTMAVLTIAMVVGTGGEGAIGRLAAEAAARAAARAAGETGAKAIATGAGETAAREAGAATAPRFKILWPAGKEPIPREQWVAHTGTPLEPPQMYEHKPSLIEVLIHAWTGIPHWPQPH